MSHADDQMTLLAPFSHGAHYVTRCIALAEALRSSEPDFKHTRMRISFVPEPNPRALIAAARRLLRHRSEGRPAGGLSTPQSVIGNHEPVLDERAHRVNEINRAFLTPEGSKIERAILRDEAYFFTTVNPASLYHQIARGETVEIAGRSTVHIIEPSLRSLVESLIPAVRVTLRQLLRLVNRFFRVNRREDWKTACVLLEHHGVLVGDLIVSQVLATDPSGGGRLRMSSGLAKVLLRSAWAVEFYRRLEVERPARSTAPEPTYLSWLLPRMLAPRGVPILAQRLRVHGAAQPELEPAGPTLPKFREELIAPSRAPYDPTDRVDLARRDDLARWMDERVGTRNALIPHFAEEPSGSARELLAALRARNPRRMFVIFLHDFRDAQLYFGINEFVDLYSWTEAAIAACARFPGAHTLVKQHPADATSLDQTNRVALDRLKRRFAGESVEFLDGSTVLHDVLDAVTAYNLVGITHHGTVAEELAWLRIPVIASRTGPWGRNYTFCPLWETREAMESLIASPMSRLRGAISREVLLDYLSVRRFQPPPKPSDPIGELFPAGPLGYNGPAAHWFLEEFSRNADTDGLMRRVEAWARRIEVETVGRKP